MVYGLYVVDGGILLAAILRLNGAKHRKRDAVIISELLWPALSVFDRLIIDS